MAYGVLSLDGGGVRGVYTARLIERLNDATGFLDHVKLVGGTSTGGILALGLAAKMTPAQLVQLYRDNAHLIFADTVFDDIADLGNLRGAEYSTKNLADLAKGVFGDKKLSDLELKVLVSSFDLSTGTEAKPAAWKPKFFNNFAGQGDLEEKVADVAVRTASAPTYFPTYQGYIDGGVVANNPSMCALAQALDDNTGGQTLDTVRLLSLGTCTSPAYVPGKDLDWGLLDWAPNLVQLMLDVSMDVADYQCSKVLGKKGYRRLNTVLKTPIGLDAVDAVEELVTVAEGVEIGPILPWLENEFKS